MKRILVLFIMTLTACTITACGSDNTLDREKEDKVSETFDEKEEISDETDDESGEDNLDDEDSGVADFEESLDDGFSVEPDGSTLDYINDQPAKSVEVSELPDGINKFIADFDIYFDYSGNRYQYDCYDISGSNILYQLIWVGPCVDYSIYPGDTENNVYWDISEGTDPRGYMDNSRWYSYQTFNADKVNWVATNIFNLPESLLENLCEEGDESGDYYLENGSYYIGIGGIGWMTPVINIKEASFDGECYYICFDHYDGYMVLGSVDISDTYNPDDIKKVVDTCEASGTYYGIFSYKEIDGDYYWSLYSISATKPLGYKDAE